MHSKPSYLELINAPRVQGKALLEDGREVPCPTPSEWRKPPPRATSGVAWSRPLTSIAASVSADKAQEYNEFYRRRGITGAEHDERGILRFSSRGQRAKCLKARGLADQ